MQKEEVLLCREIYGNKLYGCERFNKFHAWVDLLLLASDEDTVVNINGKKIQQKRGQTAQSLRSLAKRWKWSIETVVRFLHFLEKNNQISTEKNHVITLITITDFDRYKRQEDDNVNTNTIKPPIVKNNTSVQKDKSDDEWSLFDAENEETLFPLPPPMIAKKKPELADRDFEWLDAEWKELLHDWLKYKAAKKQTYKSEMSIKAFYKSLYKLSQGDLLKAKAIIEQSQANNWAGIFPIKNNNENEYQWKTNNNRGSNGARTTKASDWTNSKEKSTI